MGHPTPTAAQLLTAARLGGQLSGSAGHGHVHVHVGRSIYVVAPDGAAHYVGQASPWPDHPRR